LSITGLKGSHGAAHTVEVRQSLVRFMVGLLSEGDVGARNARRVGDEMGYCSGSRTPYPEKDVR
jgi:hypothetical protein